MEKILLLTDSASDLTPEDEARTGIRVLNLPVRPLMTYMKWSRSSCS